MFSKHCPVSIQAKRRYGFTLIELSIVLVIIGLVVGGVLVGRDMIEAARLRTVITDIETLKTSIMAFKGKYNCLPGDCANATSFGLGSNGNGNSRIGEFPFTDTNERYQFYAHLQQSQLIAGTYTGVQGAGGVRHAVPGSNVMASKISGAGYTVLFLPGYTDSNDYTPPVQDKIYDTIIFFGLPDQGSYETYAAALTPSQEFSIDAKVDDGKPASGNWINTYYNSSCVTSNNPATAAYNFAVTTVACAFLIK